MSSNKSRQKKSISYEAASIDERIKEYALIFRLPAIKESYSYIAEESIKENLSYTRFLLKLFE